MGGNESDNDDEENEGVDLEVVKKEINELMGDIDVDDVQSESEHVSVSNGCGDAEEFVEYDDELEIDAGDEKSSYVKKFSMGSEDGGFPQLKIGRAKKPRASIIEDSYLKYLE